MESFESGKYCESEVPEDRSRANVGQTESREYRAFVINNFARARN